MLMNDNRSSRLERGGIILVIGGRGFIGMNLVKLLKKQGFKVKVLSRYSFIEAGVSLIDKDCWATGDILNRADVEAACEGVTTIFHLANIAHADSRNQTYLHRINVRGTKIIKECAINSGVSRLIYFSSALADDPGSSIYARSKSEAEKVLLQDYEVNKSGNLHITILRPTNVYGPGMKGNIAGLFRRIKHGGLPVLPVLKNRISLVSVNDLCKAALLVAHGSQESGEIYTLSDGELYTPNRIQDATYKALGREKAGFRSPIMLFFAASVVAHIANTLGIWRNDLGLRTFRNLVADKPIRCKKAESELGFTPSETLETTLPLILKAIE